MSKVYSPLFINGRMIMWGEHQQEPKFMYHLQEKAPGGEWSTTFSSIHKFEVKVKRDALRFIRNNMKQLFDLGVKEIKGLKKKIKYKTDSEFKLYRMMAEPLIRKDSDIDKPLHPILMKRKLKKEIIQHHAQQQLDISGTK